MHYFECEIQAPPYEFFFQLNREHCHIDWTDYKRHKDYKLDYND